MLLYKEEIGIKGRFIMVDAVKIDNSKIIITGKLIKLAKIKEEWYEDIANPEYLIKVLKNFKTKPDIFTFCQRFPETIPKYNYYLEKEAIAVLPIKTYEYWYKKQIDTNSRRAIKRAEKKGVNVKLVSFEDEFVKGMASIFNNTPVRQGKPFWHYGKNFETIKREFSKYLYREDLIGAYYNNELIGFMFLSYAGKYALPSQIISKIEHRDKATNNALIAKAVEICAQKKIPYFVYFFWGDGTLSEFKRRNGFKKIALPRYYVPLTTKGKIILKLKLHHGILGILPEKIKRNLIYMRKKWYSRK